MSRLNSIFRNRVFQHFLFWLVAVTFWLFTMFVANSFKNVLKFEPVMLTLVFNFSFSLAVYTNLYVLLPHFFKKQRFVLYFLFLLVLISAIALFVDVLLVYPLNSFVADEGIFNELSFLVWFNLAFFIVFYVGMTSFLSFVREWFHLNKISIKIKEMEKEKLEAELTALKSQVNPHFLFNSLNNIYSLTLDGSDKAPGLVLKLSDMMRYILYECNDRFVNMEKEMEFIHNYLELQRIRLDEKIPINMELQGDPGNQVIAPLLFEPLIENAFKHGLRNRNSDAFVNIIFNFEKPGFLNLLIENSWQPMWVPDEKKKPGIGIQNVIRRLELLYPGKHQLSIDELEDRYKVMLNIELT